MNNARRRVGVLVGVLIAMCMCAMSGAACLTQSGDPASDEERQVREWVGRDIARAKAFAAAPENTHIKMVVTRGQPGTPDQVREYEANMASMRRAVEGKPDHPLREEMRTKWRFAPGASELADCDIWIGSVHNVAVGRNSVTYLNDILNEAERENDTGDNGRVVWEKGGPRSILRLMARDRAGVKEFSGTGLAYEVLFGWFGVTGTSQTPSSLVIQPDGDLWEAHGKVGNSEWIATIRWNESSRSGFVTKRELKSGGAGLSGVRVTRDRNAFSTSANATSMRVEYLSDVGETDSYIEAQEIVVTACTESDVRSASELPAAGVTENDPVRGRIETYSVNDRRVSENSKSTLWTVEMRDGLVSPASATSPAKLAQTVPTSSSRWRTLVVIGVIVVAGGTGWGVIYTRHRVRRRV